MADYRVDELAREAGTTVRNVRAYQDRGLISPPRREGRVGLYSEAHLARLKLIGQLLDRGYTLANIGELIEALERGHEVGELMGLGEALTGQWSDEVPTYVTPEELLEMFGSQASVELLQEGMRFGILEPEGERFRVASPRLLHAGAELAAAGIPLDAVLEELRKLRRDMDRVAGRMVAMAEKHIFAPYGDELPPPEDVPRLAELVKRLRPLAEMVVDAELARAMERQVNAHLGEHLTRVVEHRRTRDTAS
jgi:DNA-binding transcriptional MerR regulator